MAIAHHLCSTSPAPRLVLYLSSSQSFYSLTPSFLRKTPWPAPPAWRCSKKKEANFADQLLDYIEGGPKSRKWYGAPDLLPKDSDLLIWRMRMNLQGGDFEEEPMAAFKSLTRTLRL